MEKLWVLVIVRDRVVSGLWALLFLFMGVSAFGHSGHHVVEVAVHTEETQVTRTTVVEDKGMSVIHSDEDSPCEEQTEDSDCNTCPTGHCHLQVAFLSDKKHFEFYPALFVWIPFERDGLPINITFEPPLRPPIL